MNRPFSASAVAAGLAVIGLVTAACGSSPPAAGQRKTVTVTVTPSETITASPTQGSGLTPTPPAGPGRLPDPVPERHDRAQPGHGRLDLP